VNANDDGGAAMSAISHVIWGSDGQAYGPASCRKSPLRALAHDCATSSISCQVLKPGQPGVSPRGAGEPVLYRYY